MDINELKSKFQAAGVLLVQAEPFPDAVESGSLCVSGSLDDYLAAVKALGMGVVFVSLERLDDQDFQYCQYEDDLLEYDIDSQDLRAVNPELHFFKKYVGEIGRFDFFAPVLPKGVMFVLEQEWYERFLESRQSAVETIEEQSAGERDVLEQQLDQRHHDLVAQLEKLVSDEKFTRLPTPKAMLAYAREKIPELDDLEPSELRTAIAELKARIDARATH
jgi:hypothetical protein